MAKSLQPAVPALPAPSESRSAMLTWFLRVGLRCILVVLSAAGVAQADERPSVYVIVHPSLAQTRLETRLVADIFLKKVTRWDNGSTIHPIDLSSKSQTRQLFSQKIIKRSVSAVRSYWQQRIFSGRDVPPPEADSEQEAVRFVATHVGAIGYVSPNTDISDVKLVTLR